MSNHPKPTNLRETLHEIIFEADTPIGKAFDVMLIVCIIASVIAVMLDSVQSIKAQFGDTLLTLEWVFTILFSIEYILRLLSVRKPLRYALSFFGLVDLLSIVPTYLSLFLPGTQYLLVIRTLRTVRIWRILKLSHYLAEFDLLIRALHASFRKIFVFLVLVVCLVIIIGSTMYIVEPSENGFTSIPRSIYWAVVTLTTVGYGDISPQTSIGQFFAAVVMILGYAIIAVPTGIVTVAIARQEGQIVSTQACPSCSREGHDPDAKYCKFCASEI